eukprot:symbB.v1.2.029986.t1/scaffold3334.1/size71796/8
MNSFVRTKAYQSPHGWQGMASRHWCYDIDCCHITTIKMHFQIWRPETFVHRRSLEPDMPTRRPWNWYGSTKMGL